MGEAYKDCLREFLSGGREEMPEKAFVADLKEMRDDLRNLDSLEYEWLILNEQKKLLGLW